MVACAAPSGSTGVLGFEERYTYSARGRILTKALHYSRTFDTNKIGTGVLAASWTYNNEGQVTEVDH